MGSAGAQTARATNAPPLNATSEIMFEYTGSKAVDVIVGPVTRRLYRFDGRGARVRVDPRDRPGLMSLAVIRWVR
jgi:hypothetical protein